MNRYAPIIAIIIMLMTASSAMALPSRASTSDPAGDVVGGNSIDMTGFSVAQSGRGIVYNLIFRYEAPRPSQRIRVCIDMSKGLACMVPSHQLVRWQGKNRPARISYHGRVIRIWVRASYLDYAPGSGVRARARVFLTTASDPCAAICTEVTPGLKIAYSGQANCQAQGRMYHHGWRGAKTVALTFDDGTGPYTARIMNTLRDYQVPATFYMNGANISSSYAPLLNRMRREGHELANHSWGHERLPSQSSLRRTSQRIRAVSGVTPCTFRPPYGAVNSTVVGNAAREGMATIIWDIDTNDWRSPGTSQIIRVGSSGSNGSIVLMHDGPGSRPQTAAAVAGIINSYRSRGYEFVTVDEVLGFARR
jgi:peptidoglycan/xylan/chitin deacetylase (PgdA/CDA1 family)